MTPNVFPALRYTNARAAIDWLVATFGFEKHTEHAGPDGSIVHAELRHGPGTVGISSAGPETIDNPWTRVRQGIYVVVTDVDGHHDRAAKAGVEIVAPLADQSYGSRDYSARDAGGYLWCFGTYDMAAGAGEPTIFPEVHYKDARSAVRQLTDAFGLEPTIQVPNPDGSLMHAELRFRDSGVVMTGELLEPSPCGDTRQLTCVHVADPDAHYERALAGGAAIVKKPETTPYGARHYAARDPEGFLWLFSTYKPARPSATA